MPTLADTALPVLLLPLADLKPHPRNYRTHPEDQLAHLEQSLREHGWFRPIVVANDNTILAGHGIAEAARRLGWTEAPVVRLDLASDSPKALKVLTADNELGRLAIPDDTALASLLREIDTDLGLLGTGFDDQALRDLLADLGGDLGTLGLTDPDDVPEPPDDPITQPGDLWLLGEHRLLCGDATSEADVRRVMAGERAVLMNTDPPYLVDYDGMNHPSKWGDPDKNKDWSKRYGVKWNESGDDLSLWIGGFSRARDYALKNDAPWYVWHADRLSQELRGVLTDLGVLCHQVVIWKKNRPVLTRSWFMQAHEACLFGWVRGNKPELVSRDQVTTIWEISHDVRPGIETIHPTQKPVELFAIPMRIHTRSGDVVYEPFSGSGSQFIAAEQLGRRCYGLEIDPIYCDVVVRRWEQFTGKTAERIASSSAAA